MAWNVTITNEGLPLIAAVIMNQGTLTFTELRLSDTDYRGQEATLTEGTFGGVYLTTSATASIIDSTTIRVKGNFNGAGLTEAHEVCSLGIIATDGNDTVLLAVCTDTTPGTIEPGVGGRVSTLSFNVNLSVSSTDNITVVGTTAGVLYDIDVVDTLISTATDKPLSANMGRVLGEEVNAVVNGYGAKNFNVYPYSETTKTENGVTFTDNGDGTITLNNTANTDTWFNIHSNFGLYLENGSYKMNGVPVGAGSSCYWYIHYKDTTNNDVFINDYGTEIEFTIQGSYGDANGANVSVYLVALNGNSFLNVTIKPMIRDARIVDPTFAPYAMTNKQLTDDKAERDDLSTIHATGSTNNTGSQINAGSLFYLNGSYCKAKTSIANGATFTLNTNYEEVTVGGELNNKADKWTLVATATGDGVKTWAQVISELTSSYNASEFYKFRIVLNDESAFYPMNQYSFVQVDAYNTGYTAMYFRMINTYTNALYEANGTLTLTDYSSQVFTSGYTLKLYKIG